MGSDNAAWWNAYFAPGAGWERNGGRRQTRVYAQAFCRQVSLDPTAAFTLLDFGCALGDALRVFRRRYPAAQLFGMDVAAAAISRCQAELSGIAAFSVGGTEDVSARYSVIYSSHVLEHLPDYREAARRLLAHCDRLCLVVPFAQLRHGRPLESDPDGSVGGHLHTFARDSLDYLIEEGLASRVTTHLFAAPGARVWRKAVTHAVRNALRRLVGRPQRDLQIIYDIVACCK